MISQRSENTVRQWTYSIGILGLVWLSQACAALHQRPEVQVVSAPRTSIEASADGELGNGSNVGRLTQGAQPPPPGYQAGSIYLAGSYRGLFEDRRARRAGDILTIQIQERTSARQKANSSLGRDGKMDGSVSALPLLSANSFARAGVKGSSSNSLDSKGETGTDNTFTGSISVTVLRALPNGNLLVSGEKQVGINHNVDVMRFSGVVNPASIQPGNVVISTEVAEARLDYRGRGDMDRAQTMGFLSRFFLSWAPI
jgi:flagellar L-ring protein FlgH